MAVPADSFDHRALVYSRLNRRNQFVGFLRWAVPATGLAVAGGLIAQIIIASLGGEYSIENLRLEDGKVIIAEPRYGGQFGQGSSYEIGARSARVAMSNPEVIDLEEADIVTMDPNGDRMQGWAPSLTIDLRQETVTIDGELTTEDSAGVRAELYSTFIDWKSQSMVSQGPVRIDFPDGAQILSERLSHTANEDVWTFTSAIFDQPAIEDDPATRITAEQLIYNDPAGTADFVGNAVAEQEQARVTAQSIKVLFADGGDSDFERMEAVGTVSVHSGGQTAMGDRGVYHPDTELMDLTGNVSLASQSGSISADRLSIDIAAGTSSFSGDGGTRVRGDFSPPGADRTRIEADRLVDMRQDRRTEFTGNAVIRMAEQIVSTPRFIVHYRSGEPDQIAYYEMLGGVRVRGPEQSASGDRGIYDPDTRILRLTGNVRVNNVGGNVSAPELRVNLATNLFEFSAPGEGGRVTGLFTPDTVSEDP